MNFLARGTRTHPVAGILFEVVVQANGSPQCPAAPWCVVFMIHSSMIRKDAFESSLCDFGLTSEDIAVVTRRVKIVSGFTGTYLEKGQEVSIEHTDGINRILVEKFAAGYAPTTAGAYAVTELAPGSTAALTALADLNRIRPVSAADTTTSAAVPPATLQRRVLLDDATPMLPVNIAQKFSGSHLFSATRAPLALTTAQSRRVRRRAVLVCTLTALAMLQCMLWVHS